MVVPDKEGLPRHVLVLHDAMRNEVSCACNRLREGRVAGPADRRGAGDRAVALGPQHAGSAAHPAGPGGAPGLGAGDERPGLRSLNAARTHDGDDHRRPCDVRARTDPGAYPLRHCRCEGPWQTSWPPTRTAAEVRSPRAEGPRPGRPKAQLPPDRSRTWAEQEHRRRHRQTAPLRRRPRALTALMFQLCPLGVNLCPFYRVTPIRALEAAGFLDRAISEKGSRYQRTGAGELPDPLSVW